MSQPLHGVDLYKTVEGFPPGDYRWLQVAFIDRGQHDPDTGQSLAFRSTGLDGSFEFRGVTVTKSAFDSPNMELIGDSGYVDDNFNMYVMYRPSDKDQWLPLGTVAWGSAGQAKNEGGKWMLIPGSDMAFVANTTEETEVHPFWSDNTDVILHNPITVP